MKFKIYFIFLFAFLSACHASFDYIKINGEDNLKNEIDYLSALIQESKALEESGARLLTEGASDVSLPSLFINLFSSWEHEHEYDYDCIIVSKTFYVPIDDALSARTNTTLAACLDGTETLVPVEKVSPPYVALRVDGLSIDDEKYPLIRLAGIKILATDEKKISKQLEKKISLVAQEISNADNYLIHDSLQTVWIAAGGDLMLDRGASDILLKEGPKGIFGDTDEMLLCADITLVNLEGVVSRRGEKVPKSFNFRFIPEIAPALRSAGIDAVLHANNHVFDYGEDAFLDSLSWLERAQIGIVGAGKNIEDASRPFVVSTKGDVFHVYGIASFPRERNGWDGVTAAAGVENAGMLHIGKEGREKLKARFSSTDTAVINIVLFHGGVEWSRSPDASTRELYTDLIAAGADLVIGSHPHIVQGFEWVGGKPVFWSLGNYVFGGMGNTEGGEEGLFIRLGFFKGSLLYLEPFPLILTHTRTDIAPLEKLETFYRRSRELRRQNPI